MNIRTVEEWFRTTDIDIGSLIRIYFYNRPSEEVRFDLIDQHNKRLVCHDIVLTGKQSASLPIDVTGSYVVPLGWIRGIEKIKVNAKPKTKHRRKRSR